MRKYAPARPLAVVRPTTFRIRCWNGAPLKDVSGPNHIAAWVAALEALAALHRGIDVPLCSNLANPYYEIERITS